MSEPQSPIEARRARVQQLREQIAEENARRIANEAAATEALEGTALDAEAERLELQLKRVQGQNEAFATSVSPGTSVDELKSKMQAPPTSTVEVAPPAPTPPDSETVSGPGVKKGS